MNARLVPISLAVVALGAAACSSNSSSSGTTTTTAAKVTTTTAKKVTPTSAPATTTTAATAAGKPCLDSNLSVTNGQGSGAAGHIVTPLIFKNTGTVSCTLYGYPGVASLDAAGAQAAQATRAASPSPTLVTLAVGGTATAQLTTTDVPSGASPTCPTWSGLLVTPPNTKVSTHLTLSLSGCPGFSVTPVVAGA
jgi:hypothetical protein